MLSDDFLLLGVCSLLCSEEIEVVAISLVLRKVDTKILGVPHKPHPQAALWGVACETVYYYVRVRV